MYLVLAKKIKKMNERSKYDLSYNTICLGMYETFNDAKKRYNEYYFSFEEFERICTNPNKSVDEIVHILNKKNIKSFNSSEEEELKDVIENVKMGIMFYLELYWNKHKKLYNSSEYMNISIVELNSGTQETLISTFEIY